MKRFTALILAIAMIFSIVSCSSDDSDKDTIVVTKKHSSDVDDEEDDEEDDDNGETTVAIETSNPVYTEPTETEATTEATTAETTETTETSTTETSVIEVPVLTEGAISFEYGQYSKVERRDDDEYYGSNIITTYNPIYILDNDYKELSSAIEDHNNQLFQYTDNCFESLKVFYDMETGDRFYGTSINQNTVYRADSKVFSIMTDCYYYDSMNPSLNSDVYMGSNYWSATGDVIYWDDVFVDDARLKEILLDEISIIDSSLDADNTKESVDYLVDYYLMPYAITIDGVICYVPVLDEYYEYTIEVKIPYIGNETIFNAELFDECIVDNYVLPFNSDNSISWDVDGNGLYEYFYVYGTEEDYGITTLMVYCDETYTALDTWCYNYDAYLVHCGDSTYIWVVTTGDSDGRSIEVFDVTNGNPVYVGEEYGGIFYTPTPLYMFITERINPLSTTTGYQQCTPGDDGMPSYVTDVYTLPRPICLISKVDLDAYVVDSVTGTKGNKTVIPAGSVVKIVATNENDYVDLYVEGSDELLRLDVDLDWSWDGNNSGQKVNGMFAEDCFIGVMYAG